MDIKILNKEKNRLRFVLKEANPSYINTIRRAVTSRVPTMAISEVEIAENSSAMYDETLAHRLGLIVLKTDLKGYSLSSKCKCKGKGCAACQLSLTLNVKGPRMVYAEDLQSKDPKVKPVYPKTPIAPLLKGQSIKLIATAVLGIGKEHAKFTPGLLFYQGYPIFKIKECKNPNKVAEQCPKKILKVSGKKVQVTDETECNLCKACEDYAKDSISIEGSREDFIVTIEPWGQLGVKEMLITAVDAIDEELDDFAAEIKKIK